MEKQQKPSQKRPKPAEAAPPEAEVVPEYIHKDGYRYVKEYTHRYKAFAKKRWFGCPLWDILSVEYKLFSKEYYVPSAATLPVEGGAGEGKDHDQRQKSSWHLQA